MKKSLLSKAIVLSLMTASVFGVQGIAWADGHYHNTGVWGTGTHVVESGDCEIHSSDSAIRYFMNVDVKNGDLIIDSKYNGIEVGTNEDATATILANNINIKSDYNGIYTNIGDFTGKASLNLGSEERKLQSLTITGKDNGIDNKASGKVEVFGADDSVINIAGNASGKAAIMMGKHNLEDGNTGEIKITGGTINLSSEKGSGIYNGQFNDISAFMNVNAKQDINIKVKEYGVYNYKGKTNITSDGAVKIDVSLYDGVNTNSGSTDIVAAKELEINAKQNALYSKLNSKINLTAEKNVIIGGKRSAYASGGFIDIASNKDISLTQMQGDIFAEKNGIVKAKFDTKDSVLYGAVNTSYKETVEYAEYTDSTESLIIDESKTALNKGYFYVTNAAGDIVEVDGHKLVGKKGKGIGTWTIYQEMEVGADTDTNLKFTDGASWKMTGDSNVTHLGADKATIYMIDVTKADGDNADAEKAGGKVYNASKLTVDKALTGTGSVFAIDLDAANKNNKQESETSDYIYLNGTSEGEHYIAFDTEKSKIFTDLTPEDKLYFAYVADAAQFASLVDLNGSAASAANIYNYTYGVDKDANEEKGGVDWYVGLTDKAENENVISVDGAMKAGFALGTELDRLNKRLGEARYLDDENGLWVRYRHARVGLDSSFKTNSNMFQLGYDEQKVEQDGKHYRGVAADYTDADTSLAGVSGSGEQERYSLSLYDTWLGEKGHYRDLVIRGGRINSEFDVNTRSNENISSDYHQWFGSISGEWGRKVNTGHDWYFEPQTQLQLARVGGADYVTNYGVRVNQDAATSVIGRLGFRLGREYDKADATKRDNYYIKADLMHEFCGDLEYTVKGADGAISKEYDGKETWFDVGVGADITISRDTHFWVDIERTLGGDFDRTWQINGGLRWEW